MLVQCNVYILAHPLNEQQEQITILDEENSDFTLRMERVWSPFCYHGNVTVDISRNFVTIVSTVQSFSSIQKKSSEIFFCDFISFCVL